jgi:enhancing lycopene biosynthesis protein 2
LELREATDTVIDQQNKIVTVPVYMNGNINPSQADQGISEMISALIKNISKI